MRNALRSATLTSVLLASLVGALPAKQPDAASMAGQPLPAPELPPGAVSVRLVRERMGNDIVGHPVQLLGQGRTLTATTDAQGRAQFGDVPAGTRITVEATVDGEVLRSQEFAVPSGGGVRVALVAGIGAAGERDREAAAVAAKAPAEPGTVVFGGESRVILEFQDDNLQVFYLLDIVNNQGAPVTTPEPLIIELPDGATGAGALQGSSPLALVQGDRIRIAGPFPPGTTGVQVGYRFPYSGPQATIVQRWPAAIEQLFVAAEKVGPLQLASPQFTTQQEATAEGAPFIMATGGRLDAGATLTLNLSGLPHRDVRVRNAGLAIGVAILAIGVWVGVRRPADNGAAATRLQQRREKLFADLVELEDQYRRGRVEERRYGARRQTLVSQLERVMGELDGV